MEDKKTNLPEAELTDDVLDEATGGLGGELGTLIGSLKPVIGSSGSTLPNPAKPIGGNDTDCASDDLSPIGGHGVNFF